MLGEDLLDFDFDRANAAFVHAVPIHEITDLTSVALGDGNAAGVAIEFLGCTDESHLGALESTSGDLKLVMEFRFVVVQPTLGRFTGEEVCHRFYPRPIIERRVTKPQGEGFECRFGYDNGKLGGAAGDDTSSRRRFRRDVKGSENRMAQAFNELRIGRPNFVQRVAQAGC